MHGLRYIGDNSLHPAARIFWVIAFFWAAGCSAYFISNLFIKFHEMPVIMSISPTSSTIRDIPFPAITICNMNNMRKQQVEHVQNLYELNKGNENLTGEVALDYKLIFDYCNREPEEDIPIPSNVTTNWDYIKKFMIKMTQPCHEMLVYCQWHGDPVPCDEIFNPNLTDEGMCCVFNRLKREFIFSNPKDVSDLNVTFPGEVYEWTPERGYPDGMSFDTVPRRARGSGTHLGLTIVADAEMQQYYCSSGNSKGFKILMSNPLETPKLMSFAVPLAPGSESKVIIVPKQVTSTKDLQSIAIEKRNCYFEAEKRLFFYKTYNQRSCILECEANYTIALCGCVQYYMPKNETTRICGRNDAKCASNAQRKLDISINDAFQNLSAKGIDVPICACLPGCFELSYGFVLTSSPITTAFQIDQEMAGVKDTDYFSENMGIIHFYYMEKHFSGTVKGVLFGFTEFLSNTGGLLGLFMGFSVLSGVEILYFLLIRVINLFSKVKGRPNQSSKINTKNKTDYNFLNEHNQVLENQYPFTQ
ncbi:Amiloride-sensitive sodium channel [Nesidiocoris tenuis]|uniref:Amiloride-sensitive sodium channel n=1 Tax=Nesidiocoris tenuis TaxID=355587 RepID=A0ABN7B4E5_9HEMI|nr:Amiloride-sensitive sodium channel [Nesidiocoris tenuis]